MADVFLRDPVREYENDHGVVYIRKSIADWSE